MTGTILIVELAALAVPEKIKIIKKRLPSEAFFALLWDSGSKHILVSLHKEYKGFRAAEAIYRNVRRLYLGFIELEITTRVNYGSKR